MMCIEMVGYCAGSCPRHSIWVNYKIMATMAAAPIRASLEILAEREQNRVSEGKDGGGGATGKTDQELQHYSF
jgi:hypothetical protein